MKFIDLFSIIDSDTVIVFDGYHGMNQDPVIECKDAATNKAACSKYGHRHVGSIEAVQNAVYVWLSDDVSRLRDLANALLNQIRAFESDDFEVAKILRHAEFDAAELRFLGVGEASLYAAMD